MVVKSKWDELRNGWFLVGVPEALQHLQEPKEHPVGQELWRSLSLQDVYLSTAMSCFKLLREQGVSGTAIIAHALRNCLAPLQKRPHPAWNFQGPKDPSRLRNSNMEDSALVAVMKTIFTPAVKYQLPEGVRPLCEDPQREETLAAMPACNTLGIEGRTDSEPQATKAKTRKAKAPSSSGEDEDTSESEEESTESSEEESSRSKEDEDGGSDGEESEGDDEAGRDVSDDKEEEAGEGPLPCVLPRAPPRP